MSPAVRPLFLALATSLLLAGSILTPLAAGVDPTSDGRAGALPPKKEATSAAKWTKMNPGSAPPTGWDYSLAYDPVADRTILYCGYQNETWSYDYEVDAWTKQSPNSWPSAKMWCEIVYDERAGKVILVGAYASNKSLPLETWSYDLASDKWTDLRPTTSPSPRTEFSLVYHSGMQRVLMFGGEGTAPAALDETWAYDSATNNWTDLAPTTRPSGRSTTALAYDTQSDVVVLFGGWVNLEDTWTYSRGNNTWSKMSPPAAGTPVGRQKHGMAYDLVSDRVVLFGGYVAGGGGARDETHLYDFENDSWAEVTPSPSPPWSQEPGLAYDLQSDRVIEFGGAGSGFHNQTWAFDDPYEGPPQVVTTTPADGAKGVPVSSLIGVTFSTGMATASVESAISSNPTAPGKFAWVTGDVSVTLDPAADLQFSTKFTFTIATGARSKGGTAIASAYLFSFTTEDRPPPVPRIIATAPTDGSVGVAAGSTISVTFDQEMDAAATEAAISITPTVNGAVTWDASAEILTLAPSSPLADATTYSVTVGTAARSKAGVALPTAHVFGFNTASPKDSIPPMISHTPPGPVEELTPLKIVASVIDGSGVGAVRLHYRFAGQPAFSMLPMSRGDSDRFSATIPGASVMVDRVEYYIEASDTAGNSATSPIGAPGSFHSVVVTAAPVSPKKGFDWTLVFVALAIILAAVALLAVAGRRKRRPQCRWCGSPHSASAPCSAGAGGWPG